ncbi:AAA family ATPase [Frankia sp. CNm7]|uniref:AAA family ATPase n=1 Tax=Frankia nepalensis TaxID=1836974 RepID=A0A937URP4_9ACTN|nr:AAA family ATPase [Frankia nepalensis]MBL7497325.1 AAA family ATPase [Frankia nepalensis]MBL7509718.1 AAA family ATPase [Frankia nepalensis]MBL7516934.1 AAA family ATPase [Frankia nepalensis]MBL7629445.1 AAA family ATPase [Frankia nepalensis]
MPFVPRLRVRDFRSIADCDLALGPLTVVVGFNASGKSNLLDALRFVADAVRTSPVRAVEDRGGLDALLRRGRDGQAESFEIVLDLLLPPLSEGGEAVEATYGFAIGRGDDPGMSLAVLRERCRVGSADGWADTPGRPRARLRLPAEATRDDRFAAVEESLLAMRFYDLEADALRALEEGTGRRSELGPSGGHLGQVLDAMATADRAGKERLDAYLAGLVPGAVGMDERREGRYSTVEARFRHGEAVEEVDIVPRESLSEGTLRATGVLAALFQQPVFTGQVSLLGIEEPEKALHPAAVGGLYEALDDAARHTQVIVTSQSSDLLDNEYVRLDHIRAVASVDGVTRVGEVDSAGQAIVAKQLMTISQLHRAGQLMPAAPTGGGPSAR